MPTWPYKKESGAKPKRKVKPIARLADDKPRKTGKRRVLRRKRDFFPVVKIEEDVSGDSIKEEFLDEELDVDDVFMAAQLMLCLKERVDGNIYGKKTEDKVKVEKERVVKPGVSLGVSFIRSNSPLKK